MAKVLKLQAYLTRFNRKADRSCNITFETQEISSEELGEIDEHYQSFGWLLFAPQASERDIPKEMAVESGSSPSERLRNVLFVWWKNKINKGDFEVWRRQQMEIIIDTIKKKID